MLKGDMCLKVVEHGKHRDVPIKEGEVSSIKQNRPLNPREIQRNILPLILMLWETWNTINAFNEKPEHQSQWLKFSDNIKAFE